MIRCGILWIFMSRRVGGRISSERVACAKEVFGNGTLFIQTK
jgi:hypothetical protein